MNGTLDFSEIKVALINWDKEIKKKLLRKIFKVENDSISLLALKHQFSTILPHEWSEFTRKAKFENEIISLANLKAYIKYTLDLV